MTIGLFVPCYIDQFYPAVARAALICLERYGCEVVVPLDQTCCGQPLGNAGYERDSVGALELFARNFRSFDYVVAPSGSCVLYVREHIGELVTIPKAIEVGERTFEFCEFVSKVLGVSSADVRYERRVGLHNSCHGLRGLGLGVGSERMLPEENLVRDLLSNVEGIQLVDLERPDECCGFGGTFAMTEEAISMRMGMDRLADHMNHGTEIITATDMSCLMHLDGLIRRNKLPLKVAHVAEILAGTAP
jgi:L-lactate dehydrogenase complex protein LldE